MTHLNNFPVNIIRIVNVQLNFNFMLFLLCQALIIDIATFYEWQFILHKLNGKINLDKNPLIVLFSIYTCSISKLEIKVQAIA